MPPFRCPSKYRNVHRRDVRPWPGPPGKSRPKRQKFDKPTNRKRQRPQGFLYIYPSMSHYIYTIPLRDPIYRYKPIYTIFKLIIAHIYMVHISQKIGYQFDGAHKDNIPKPLDT